MTNPELVTALDLDQWSSSLNAQSTLPVLLRRLILATASVAEIAMRGREGALLPGWDGVVKATGEDPHVPAGTSGWEIGTSSNPRDKAQSDYRARTNDPLGIDPAATTFVAATSRIWRDRDDWRSARRVEGLWADVRAYDADDLETWLERAPSVHVWISELLGREPRDVKTPERWWATWSSQTHPVLPPAFLLAGRNTGSVLRNALARSTQVVSVDAPSKEEALAVICAVLADDSDEVDDLAARTLVVSGAGAWDRMVESDTGLVLIPTFEEPDVSTALSKGHRVVVPASRLVRPRGVEVEVVPIDRFKAAEALVEAAGLDRDKADGYAAHARRNLLSLRRTIANSPAFKRPSWSRTPEAGRLAPLLLVGAWRQDSEGDREVIEVVTGRSYTDVETDLAAWSVLEDAPLRRSGQTWSMVSKDDAWDLISPLITLTDLNRFSEIAVRVLQEQDPALDLPTERRFMAAIVGEARTYSVTLRGSIADTIALLGGYAGDQRLSDNATGQEHADRLVRATTRNLNSDPTGRAWQSLADVLPLLAEASPDQLLDAVEAGLAGDYPLLRLMFFDSEMAATFGATSPHFSLVWALETLCWSPDHLSRAATALARLADIDPEPKGRSNPRPAASLASIFRLYWTQTSAPLKRRIAVLDRLRHHALEVTWPLLVAIIPAPGVGFPTHRPRWRPWAQGRVDEINAAEVAAGTAEIVTRLLHDADTDAARWIDLIGRIDVLPIGDRERVLSALQDLDPSSVGQSGKAMVWRSLVDLTRRHIQFQDAGWAMPADVVSRIEDIAVRFAPVSLIDLHTDLFDHHPRLPGIDPQDYVSYDGALRTARQKAASDILDSGGVTALLALGTAVKVPWAVGWAAAGARGDRLAGDLLQLLDADGTDRQVAFGYAAGRIDAEGLDWIERELQRSDLVWTPGRQAGLLLAVPRPSTRLLAIVGQRPPEVREAFWQRINPMFSEEDARTPIALALIERRRPWSAITVLVGLVASGSQSRPSLDTSLVELALYRAATGPSDDVQQAASLSWEVGELLDYLERVGSDAETRAQLEFLFMPLLQHTRSARALEEALRSRPAFFTEIVSVVYRAKDDPDDEPVPPNRKALAEAGFAALRSWHTAPGTRPDGTMDAHELREWTYEARALLERSGRRTVGDIVIGEVLAYAPPDSDGLWPGLPIRDLIEDIASPELEQGLQTGKFNSRGVVTRDPTAGGEQERSLAKQFSGWAERVADQWPRTGAMLRGLAASYETWGRREDDLVENYADPGNYSRLNRLSEIAEDQWGLVTRRQADLAGISDATLLRLVTRGVLERVAQDVYLLGATMPDHLNLRAAWLQLAPRIPAWDRTPDQGVVSHRSAAALYGLGHLPADKHDFTFPKPHPSQRPDVRIHQRKVHQNEWIRLHGLPTTRPSRIAADLLGGAEDPEAVAYVVADAIRAGFDYPTAFADAVAPYASDFGLAPDDGIALVRWLLDLVGAPEAELWIDEATRGASSSAGEEAQRPPPHPDAQNRHR